MTPNENTTPETMTLQVNNFPADLQKQGKALAALAGISFREFVIGSIQTALARKPASRRLRVASESQLSEE